MLWGVIAGTYSTIYVAAPLEWYLAGRGGGGGAHVAREAAQGGGE
jgi:preprotein translocase subunit SecF